MERTRVNGTFAPVINLSLTVLEAGQCIHMAKDSNFGRYADYDPSSLPCYDRSRAVFA